MSYPRKKDPSYPRSAAGISPNTAPKPLPSPTPAHTGGMRSYDGVETTGDTPAVGACPLALLPQQAIVPSLFSPQV